MVPEVVRQQHGERFLLMKDKGIGLRPNRLSRNQNIAIADGAKCESSEVLKAELMGI